MMKLNRSRYVAALSVLFLLFMGFDSHANVLRKMKLEDIVASSDTVVLARVVVLNSAQSKLYDGKIYTVLIEKTLKGNPPKTISLNVDTGIVEQNPSCCNIGKVYLLFLKKAKRDFYVVVNGSFGAYEI